jgi:hypothetical protein
MLMAAAFVTAAAFFFPFFVFFHIAGGEFKFGRRAEEAKLLGSVTPAELLAFFDKYIAEGGAGRRCLTSQVWFE